MLQGRKPLWRQWTQADSEKLVALWAKGWSASQIGAELGYSRSAVMGRVSRIRAETGAIERDIPKPRPPKPLSTHPAAIRTRARRAALKDGKPPAPKPEKKAAARPLPIWLADFALPESRRLSLFDLKSIHCRFPIGDPSSSDFCYCGADREKPETHQPYCTGHAALAYRPAPERKSVEKAYR